MGLIKISVEGSFSPNTQNNFSAMSEGHASAVAKAIEWLSVSILPMAIRLDHSLQSKNEEPQAGFCGHKIKKKEGLT